jgi:hypothetical protein
MPTSGQDIRLPEKLYPMGLEIPDALKRKIFAPEVIGKVLEERERLEERPSIADKFSISTGESRKASTLRLTTYL